MVGDGSWVPNLRRPAEAWSKKLGNLSEPSRLSAVLGPDQASPGVPLRLPLVRCCRSVLAFVYGSSITPSSGSQFHLLEFAPRPAVDHLGGHR